MGHDGIWLDKQSGELTTTKPKRAKLIVAPGDDVPEEVAELLGAKAPKPTGESKPTRRRGKPAVDDA